MDFEAIIKAYGPFGFIILFAGYLLKYTIPGIIKGFREELTAQRGEAAKDRDLFTRTLDKVCDDNRAGRVECQQKVCEEMNHTRDRIDALAAQQHDLIIALQSQNKEKVQ